MEKQLLEKGWFLALETGERLETRAPFSVYSDLLNHGKMEDPFWRDNENRALPLMEKDYSYTLEFDAQPEILASAHAALRCEGLDTLAELTLNGTPLGRRITCTAFGNLT